MTITFRTTDDDAAPRTLSLNEKGTAALPVETIDGRRVIGVNWNLHGNNGTMNISEIRCDRSGAPTLRKSIILSPTEYTMDSCKRLDGDVMVISVSSHFPIRFTTDPQEQGHWLYNAHNVGNYQEVNKLKARMRLVLGLGKLESWFQNQEVTRIEIRIPNCDSNKFVSFDSFTAAMAQMHIVQPQLLGHDYISETRRSLIIENELEDDEKAKLARANVTCRFLLPSGRPEQLHVRMTLNRPHGRMSSWGLTLK